MGMQFATEQEHRLLMKIALLPMVIRIFHHDLAKIQNEVKFPQPYEDWLKKIIEQAGRDLRVLPTYLRERQVKVISKKDTENGISMKYIVRGYHHEMNFLWKNSRGQLQELMTEYMKS